jgi:hypothetical protein
MKTLQSYKTDLQHCYNIGPIDANNKEQILYKDTCDNLITDSGHDRTFPIPLEGDNIVNANDMFQSSRFPDSMPICTKQC